MFCKVIQGGIYSLKKTRDEPDIWHFYIRYPVIISGWSDILLGRIFVNLKQLRALNEIATKNGQNRFLYPADIGYPAGYRLADSKKGL